MLKGGGSVSCPAHDWSIALIGPIFLDTSIYCQKKADNLPLCSYINLFYIIFICFLALLNRGVHLLDSGLLSLAVVLARKIMSDSKAAQPQDPETAIEKSSIEPESQQTPSKNAQDTQNLSAFASLGLLDRFLAVWIFLAMAVGIILGNFVPSMSPALAKGTFVGVSVPIGK